MLSIVAIIFGLGVIVFFHEMGHFLMAKAVGLDVPRFSIGFPPFILRKKLGDTEYCIGAIPLGGYDKVNLGTTGDPVEGISWFKRSLVALAGPFANLVLTAVILILIFGVVGWDISISPAIVGNSDNLLGLGVGDTVLSVNDTPVNDYFEMLNELTEASDGTLLIGSDLGRSEIQYSLPPDSIPFHPLVPAVIGESIVGLPAYESGIRAGDSITAIDGRSVAIWYDYQEIVSSTTDELAITFCRNGIKDTVYVTPHEYDGQIISGVTVQLPSERVKLPPGEAFVEGLKAAGRGAVGFCATLIKLIKKPAELAESSGGPIYVAETLGQQARSGLPSYLWTIANISLAIMIFNLLPIPILDGGQIVILLCEGIRGKPISKKHVQIIQQTGMILILMIFILIMFKDISRLVTRVR